MIDPKKEKSKFFRIFVYTKITANSLLVLYSMFIVKIEKMPYIIEKKSLY